MIVLSAFLETALRRAVPAGAAALRAWWLALALAWWPGAGAQGLPSAALALHQAEFSLRPHGPWQTVALPDTWVHRGVAPHQVGHYRAQFRLPVLPRHALAVRIDRLSRVHELRLNGQLLQGNLGVPESALRRPVPTLVVMPPALLREGDNLLELVVDAGARAGLSPLLLGPQDELDEGFLWSYHRSATLPQFMNAASAGMALFMALLWWRRRQDVALGAFAALSLLASLRNIAYFNSAPFRSTAVTDTLFFSLQAATVVLLGLFALHHAGVREPAARRLRGLLWAVLVGYPLVGAVASFAGEMHDARGWLYPLLMVLAAAALGLIFHAALRRRHALDVLLLVSFTAVLVAGVHDYLYQQGHTSVMDSFWLPYATPVALVAYTLGLLGQLARALRVSERHAEELERRVAERTAQLQAANAARLRYLAAAGHDLRQPLVSIGLLGGLLGRQALPQAAAGVLQRLQQAVEHMDGLFDRLLAFSRLEAAAVSKPQLQPVRLQALFDAVQAHALAEAQARGLRLRVRPTAAVVLADRTLLEQIVRNLMANALRYTASGTVLLAARPQGGGWRIEVRDSGPGIAPADQGRIFDEFVRLPQQATAADSGLGLGLAIAQRQARLLGSAIELQSAPGRGSRFWLLLAAAAAPDPAA